VSDNKLDKRHWPAILKTLVAGAAFFFIAYSIFKQIEAGKDAHIIDFDLITIILVFLLMPVNWLVESIKWKQLTSVIQPLSLWSSLKSVLSGLSVSMMTPNRIGDFAGRILILSPENRAKGAMATLIGSCAQMLAIAAFGVLAFAFDTKLPDSFVFLKENYYTILIILIILLLISIILFFCSGKISAKIRFRRSQVLQDFIDGAKIYNPRQMLSFISISALRYILFSSQFYLALWAFGVELEAADGFCAIAFMYCFVTIIPSFALAEWGIRGSMALLFIQPLGGSAVAITAASIAVWLINVGVPALLGTLAIVRTKTGTKQI